MSKDFQAGIGAQGAPRSAAKGEGRRVLLVDDDIDVAESPAELLAISGHNARIATSGQAALALFEEWQPEVAVLDIGLPVMDGYELQARMCALRGGSECTFVALTGYGMKSEQEASRQAGFRAHLVKPVDVKQLTNLISGSTGGGR